LADTVEILRESASGARRLKWNFLKERKRRGQVGFAKWPRLVVWRGPAIGTKCFDSGLIISRRSLRFDRRPTISRADTELIGVFAVCGRHDKIRESNMLRSPEVFQHSSSPCLHLTINGRALELDIAPWVTLLDLLRGELKLYGTKKGCDHGQCGACTVLIDGQRINSCLKLAVTLDGADITTVEGLGDVGALHAVQQAFIDHDAFQCGYCTPGQICSAIGLINEGHAQSREDIRELMSGNLCRCGAYTNIADAIEAVLTSKVEAAA
jgi:xanthine dehydrogenase YagT iron-sulfur-binding subunit